MKNMKRNLLVAALGLTMSAGAMGIIVDGKLDPLSDWNHTFSVGFVFDGGKTGTGFLALGNNDDKQVLYYSVPKQFVDNSWGDNSIGWGASAETGKNHNYKDLVGSDKLEFTILNSNDIVHDFNGGTNQGSSIVTAAQTSLEFNRKLDSFDEGSSPALDGTNPDYTDDSDANYLNSSDSDWIFDVAYEIEFAKGTFNETAWSDGSLDGLFEKLEYKNHAKSTPDFCTIEHESYNEDKGKCLIKDGKKDKKYDLGEPIGKGDKVVFTSYFGGHASPSKVAVLETTFTSCADNPTADGCGGTPNGGGGGEVPVPASFWLLLAGLFGIGISRKQAKA